MRLSKLLIHLKSSLWFVPVLCVLAGAALSFGTIALDRYFDYQAIPQSLVGGPDAATAILGTVAASMVSLTALVLTITMVVVQLAMGQFSPRIVQRILQDKPSQLAIGLFVATFVHAILALREVTNNGDGSGHVPGVAVVDGVRARAREHRRARDLRAAHRTGATRLRADRASRQGHARADRRHVPATRDTGDELRPERRSSRGAESGVITGIGLERAGRGGATGRLPCSNSCPRSASSSRPERRCSGSHGDRDGPGRGSRSRALILQLEPTLDEDVAYGIRLLVDIAERSLAESPFQDPTTAVQAIDRLHDILRQLARRPFPDGRHRDEAGEVQADREDDELGRLRPPRNRRDPHGRRRLATGGAATQGRARGSADDRAAGARRDPRRAARPARSRDRDGHGRPARRRLGLHRDPEGIGAAARASERRKHQRRKDSLLPLASALDSPGCARPRLT